MKVKFLEDRRVYSQGVLTGDFRAGQVYELSAASGRRWLRRQVAVEIFAARETLVDGDRYTEATSNTSDAPTAAETTSDTERTKRKYIRRKLLDDSAPS